MMMNCVMMHKVKTLTFCLHGLAIKSIMKIRNHSFIAVHHLYQPQSKVVRLCSALTLAYIKHYLEYFSYKSRLLIKNI